MRKPILFNVSGPYAVGKDTILNAILREHGDSVYRVHTVTTRPVTAEADPTYSRVSMETMRKLETTGRWIVNYQLSGHTAYGTNLDEIYGAVNAGRIPIHSIYAGPRGAGALRSEFGRRLISVALVPSGVDQEAQTDVLRQRLQSRDRDDPDAVDSRLRHQVEPLRYVRSNPLVATSDGDLQAFDYVVTNENLNDAVAASLKIFEEQFIL